MLDMDRLWRGIYENFKAMCPLLEEKVIAWWPSGRDSIIVKLNDGSKLVYDNVREMVWNVRDTKGDDELEWRKYFSRKLEELMWTNGIDGKQLADRVGVSGVMISRYLNRKSTPSPFIIQKIARVLGTTVSELTEFVDVE